MFERSFYNRNDVLEVVLDTKQNKLYGALNDGEVILAFSIPNL